MQQSVVPQVGVVQTVLGSFAVVPEGQEKLTLPQVALTVRGHTHKHFSRCPLSPSGQMGTAALRRAVNRQTSKRNKRGLRKKESSEDRILLRGESGGWVKRDE